MVNITSKTALEKFAYEMRQTLKNVKTLNTLAAVFSIVAIFLGIATYAALSKWGQDGATNNIVIGLIKTDFFILAILGILLTLRVVRLWNSRRAGAYGSRLHVRLALLFSVVAIVPTIIMMIFAASLFSRGVESWFSERVKTALIESAEIADAYLAEHNQLIRADALSVASDINSQWPKLNQSREVLNGFLSTQAALRGLTEAVIFREDMQVIAKAGYTFALQTGEQIPFRAIALANMGDVAVLAGERGDRVRALVRLGMVAGGYLYVGRFIDAKVLSRVKNTQDAVDDYLILEGRRSDLEISFTLLFLVLGLLLLMLSVWFGLALATRLARPIVDLIEASERVRRGDLTVQVKERAANDEVASLSRSFNRMTTRLATQRDALVDANGQLDERRQFTEAVLSGVTSGVVGLDPLGRITLPNRAASDLLRIDLTENIGVLFSDIVPEMTILFKNKNQDQISTIEKEIKIIRQTKIIVLLVRLTVEESENRVLGYVITFDDITELLAAQRKAAWSDVARRIAHEIKNPLTPIQLSAERLAKHYTKDPHQDAQNLKEYTKTIIRQVHEIGKMVDEFSSFARLPQPSMSETDIIELTKRVVLLYKSAYPNLLITFHPPPETILILCDAAQITQVITNILENAVQAIDSKKIDSYQTEETGKVLISLEKKNHEVVFSVIDNGVGLPDTEVRQRLTEPYITTRSKGTGLGLAIVLKILEDHRGRLVIDDSAEGGAKVAFYIAALQGQTVEGDFKNPTQENRFLTNGVADKLSHNKKIA